MVWLDGLERILGMSSQNDRNKKQLIAEAEKEFLSGKISRRDFGSLMVWFGVASGFNFLGAEGAVAWVGTRLRKGKASAGGTGSNYGLRFTNTAQSYLTRTLAAAGDRRSWTMSFWIKRSQISDHMIIGVNNASDNNSYLDLRFTPTGQMCLTAWSINILTTNALFRDLAAWYHITVKVDTTQAVAKQRASLFVNGVEVSSFATDQRSSVTQNMQLAWGLGSVQHNIGRLAAGCAASCYGDMYLSEFYYVDGIALNASSFAEVDVVTGAWIPKTYASSFGTNGFRLSFSTATSTTTLGADTSGNNQPWTLNNHNTFDQVLDSPGNNFCTLSEIGVWSQPAGSIINGGLLTTSAGANHDTVGTISPDTGKWYFEAGYVTAVGTNGGIGVSAPSFANATGDNTGTAVRYTATTGGVGAAGSTGGTGTFATYGLGDVIGVAYDCAAGTIALYKNNTLQTIVTGAVFQSVPLSPWIYNYTGNVFANFGQGGVSGLTYDSASGGRFKYTPPLGFKALSTANLSTPLILKPKDYFNTLIYSGNGSDQHIGGYTARASSYNIARSLRFNSADSPYLGRTPSSAGDLQKFTLSIWFKRSLIGTQQYLFNSYASTTTDSSGFFCYINTNNKLYLTGSLTVWRASTQTFANTSDWNHIVVSVDTTQVLAADRMKVYLNGTEITAWDTNAAVVQNLNTAVNNTYPHYITTEHNTAGYFSGYLAEINLIDGQALTATNFGMVDTGTGEWVPTSYLGTYGLNGCYVNFSDNSNTTAATLGKDSAAISGAHTAANNWTPFNFSVAAGIGNDSLTDTPTANYPTICASYISANLTLSNANMTVTCNGNASDNYAYSPVGLSSGKWYWEINIDAIGGSNVVMGVFATIPSTMSATPLADAVMYWTAGGGKICSPYYAVDSQTGLGSATTGDVIGISLDMDNLTVQFYKMPSGAGPRTALGTAEKLVAGKSYYPVFDTYLSGALSINFGQRSFVVLPPTGFQSINQANLASVTNQLLNFQPDLVWIKSKNAAQAHAWYDSSRGVRKDFESNSLLGDTIQSTGLQSFDKKGFSVSSLAKLNTAANTYISWCWKKGFTPGFDIVTYSGDGSNSRTISHGLGVKPAFYITKCRTNYNNGNGFNDWAAYHKSLPQTGAANTNGPLAGYLHSTGIPMVGVGGFCSAPTTSLFAPNQQLYDNVTGETYIAYLFAEVSGFSRMSSYIGNGSADGPFVWCGFRPAFLMVKDVSQSVNWLIYDNTRDNSNVMNSEIFPNTTAAETTALTYDFDFLSNGFKLRRNSTVANSSGDKYIFVAFAEAPFKNARAR